MYLFGSGVLIGTLNGANPTPINLGLVQNVTLDDTGNLKPLFGQFQRPVAVGRGTTRTTIKATLAKISGYALGVLYFGVAPVSGQVASVMGEAGTVPGVSTYTITVANSATWTVDQGVIYAATGLPLKRVASGPTIGQYSVAAGVYTFAAADASTAMLLSYSYTISASGQKITINNPNLGPTITFGMLLNMTDPTTNLTSTLQLYNCVSSKFSMGTKLEDFAMPDFEAEAYVNAAGNLGVWSFADAA